MGGRTWPAGELQRVGVTKVRWASWVGEWQELSMESSILPGEKGYHLALKFVFDFVDDSSCWL